MFKLLKVSIFDEITTIYYKNITFLYKKKRRKTAPLLFFINRFSKELYLKGSILDCGEHSHAFVVSAALLGSVEEYLGVL